MFFIDKLLSNIARSLCQFRVHWSLGFLAIGLLAVLSVFQIHLDLDFKDFLPSQHLSIDEKGVEQLNKEVVNTFGGKATTVIVIRGDKKIDVNSISPLINTLSMKLEGLDSVQKVTYRLDSRLNTFIKSVLQKKFLLYLSSGDLSRFSERISRSGMESRILENGQGGIWQRFLLNRDPLNVSNIARPYFYDLLAGFRIKFIDGYFVSRDQRAFFILIEPKNFFQSTNEVRVFTGEIDRILNEIKTAPLFESLFNEISLTPVGSPYISNSAFDTTLRDSKQALLTSAISIFLFLTLLYKRVAAAVILSLPVLFGLLITMALGVWFFPSINLFSFLFSAVLAGLGFTFAIHIGTHYWMHSKDNHTREETLALSMIRPGKGILFGALTTAAAFSSLFFSQYSGISQVGILTAVGILVMMVSSFTLFPFFISMTKPSFAPINGMNRWTNGFVFLSETYPKTGLVFWIVMVSIATVGVTRVKYEDHPWNVAVRGNENAEALLELNREIKMSFAPILIVSRAHTEEEAIEKDRQVTRVLSKIRRKGGIAFYQSITSLFPEEEQQRENMAFIQNNPELFSPERFRRDFHKILMKSNRNLVRLYETYTNRIAGTLSSPGTDIIHLDDLKSSGLDKEVARFVGQIGEYHVAVTYVYLKKFPWIKGVVPAFKEAFDAGGGGKIEGISLAGNGLQSVSHAHLLKREVIQIGSIALAWISILILLAFRRPSSVVMTLLPLLASVWITLGITGFLGIEINFLTLSIMPILLGIGIDDGIHVMERYRREGSIHLVLKETGAGLTATTLTTAFAFLSFCIAGNDAVRDFGLVAAVGIILCLLASLHLLPCLLVNLKGE